MKHENSPYDENDENPLLSLPEGAWSLDETSLAWLMALAKAHNPRDGPWTVWPGAWGPVLEVPVHERGAWLDVLSLIDRHPRMSIGTTRTVIGNRTSEAIVIEGEHGGPYALAVNGYLEAWTEPVWLSSTIPAPIVKLLEEMHDLPMGNHLPHPRDGVCLEPQDGSSLPMALNTMLRLMLDELSLYEVATNFHMVPCSNAWCTNFTPHEGRIAQNAIVAEECQACRSDPPETN